MLKSITFRFNICFCFQEGELKLPCGMYMITFMAACLHLACSSSKVLLSQDELLQLSGVQCIAEVLTHHAEYGRVLLNEDIAGKFVMVVMDGTDNYVCLCV